MREIYAKSFFQRSGTFLLAVVCVAMIGLAVGQTGGPYVLEWSTMDGGGGVSSGGQYVLTGTIGQADAAYSAGGQYELLGGFWPAGPLCIVDFRHFARFAEHWLEEDCDELNDYCDGANLDYVGDVNTVDLGLFVDEWLNYCPYDWPLR
jgi:hypothetical protein